MNKKFINEYGSLLAIVTLALLIRVVYYVDAKPWENDSVQKIMQHGDAGEYQRLAEKLVETGSYPENFFLDTYRTPVFPVYISALYFFFGVKPHIVLFSHIILNLVIIFFLFLLCRKLFDNIAVAIVASLLYALEPNVIKLIMEFGTETLHAALLIVSVYFFVAGLKENKIINVLLSAVFFGITALTRPVNLYFYLLCVLFIFLFPEQKLKYKFKTAVFFVLVYFASIAPWMYRNYNLYDHFSTNAFQGTAVYYNAIITKSYVTGKKVDSVIVEVVTEVENICKEKNITNPFDVDKEKQIYGMNYIKNYPGVYLMLHLKGMANFFIAPLNNEKYSVKSKILIALYFLFVYSFALVGIYVMIKKKQYYYLFVFLSVILYFWFITGILGLSRYRMPATAFYIMLCAVGVCFISEKIKNKIESIRK